MFGFKLLISFLTFRNWIVFNYLASRISPIGGTSSIGSFTYGSQWAWPLAFPPCLETKGRRISIEKC